MATPIDRTLPLVGRTVKMVPRDQLKANGKAPRFRARSGGTPLPPGPASQDWSLGRKVKYPLDGNDRYGDCYMVAAVHASSGHSALQGPQWDPSEADIVSAYLNLAGGDYGLDDGIIMPYWARGLLGTGHRLLGWAVMPNPTVPEMLAWMRAGCGLIMTMGMPDRWLQIASPGCIWDAKPGDRSNPSNGHAVYWSGRGKGWSVETWGFAQPPQILDSGMSVCDPEVIVVITSDLFGEYGLTPNGDSWDDVNGWWTAMGAPPLAPINPGPQPTPPPPGPPRKLLLSIPVPVPVEITGLADIAGIPVMTDSECLRLYGLTWQQFLAALLAFLQGLLAAGRAGPSR